jgi:hypothetical protein
MRALLLLGILGVSLFAGCSSSNADPLAEELVDSESAELSTSQNANYYIVSRQDLRTCAAPACGGFYVRRLNTASMRCADGSYAAECYVDQINASALGLSSEQLDALNSGEALIKASRSTRTLGGRKFIKLTAQEAWFAQGRATSSVPAGTFLRVVGAGAEYRLEKLNGSVKANIENVDLARSGSTSANIGSAMASLSDPAGFLAVGGLLEDNAGFTFVASQFYTRAVAQPEGRVCGSRSLEACPTGQDCIYAQGDICGRADASGTCRNRPSGCSTTYSPVCGCSGITYRNECQARAAGTSVDYSGTCR